MSLSKGSHDADPALGSTLSAAAGRRAGVTLGRTIPFNGRGTGEPVNAVLGAINLVDVARSDLMYAAALPGRLRSADAIHLAAPIRLQRDVVVAYDAEFLAAALEAGLNVLSP